MTAPFRLPRAIAFTAAMLTLAAGAHLLAGGILPPPVILAGIVALVLAPVTILSKTKINAPAMTGLLASSQMLLHWAFDALSVSATFTPADGAHGHGALPASSMAAALAPGHDAVATALVLARGEAAVWALAAWLRPLVRILAAVAIPEWPHISAPAAVVIAFRWRNLRLPALRGPPSFHAAL